jgi:MFS transporter, ACDE family, multidrug resistance protein
MPPASETVQPSPVEPLRLSPELATVFAVTLMAVLGVASVAPVFPSVARHFGADASRVGLLITAFTLPGVVLSPLLGAWADRWGRRAVLVPSLLVFAVAGVACAFASSLPVLVALRLVQGIGAAPLGSLNVTLIGDLYHGRRQVAAMGANAAVLSVGTATYPLLGGVLADFDWRLPFALPLLALPVAWFAAHTLPRAPHREPESLPDYFGRVARGLDAHRLGLMTASLLTFVVLYGSYLTYLPFHMDARFGASPTVIGAVFFSASVATMLVSLRLAPITERIGRRRALLLAYALYAASMLSVLWLPSVEWMVLPAVLFGLGNGLNIPTLSSWLAASVDRDVRAGIMALNSVALRGGQTLGPLVAGAGFAMAGIEGAFATGVIVSILLAGLSVLLGPGKLDTPRTS